MTDVTAKLSNVADLTLGRVRRLESSVERLNEIVSIQNEKMDALINLAPISQAS